MWGVTSQPYHIENQDLFGRAFGGWTGGRALRVAGVRGVGVGGFVWVVGGPMESGCVAHRAGVVGSFRVADQFFMCSTDAHPQVATAARGAIVARRRDRIRYERVSRVWDRSGWWEYTFDFLRE